MNLPPRDRPYAIRTVITASEQQILISQIHHHPKVISHFLGHLRIGLPSFTFQESVFLFIVRHGRL